MNVSRSNKSEPLTSQKAGTDASTWITRLQSHTKGNRARPGGPRRHDRSRVGRTRHSRGHPGRGSHLRPHPDHPEEGQPRSARRRRRHPRRDHRRRAGRRDGHPRGRARRVPRDVPRRAHTAPGGHPDRRVHRPGEHPRERSGADRRHRRRLRGLRRGIRRSRRRRHHHHLDAEGHARGRPRDRHHDPHACRRLDHLVGVRAPQLRHPLCDTAPRRGRGRAVPRRRHAERPLDPHRRDHQRRQELRLGRRRLPQRGAVLHVVERLRRAAQHVRSRQLRLRRAHHHARRAAIRRVLLRRRLHRRARLVHQADGPADDAARLRARVRRRRLLQPFEPDLLGLEGPGEAAHPAGTRDREGLRRERHARRMDARERRVRLRVPGAARDRRRDRGGDRAEDRPLDPALADPAGVRGRRGRRAPAQARRRMGGLGLPARAHRLRSGPRRHRAVLRRPRHLADGRGLGGFAALRHAVDGRPLGQPRRRALAGLGAHGRRQLGPAVHDGRRRRHLRRLGRELRARPAVEGVRARALLDERLGIDRQAPVAVRRAGHRDQPVVPAAAPAADAVHLLARGRVAPQRPADDALDRARVPERPGCLQRRGEQRVPARQRLPRRARLHEVGRAQRHLPAGGRPVGRLLDRHAVRRRPGRERAPRAARAAADLRARRCRRAAGHHRAQRVARARGLADHAVGLPAGRQRVLALRRRQGHPRVRRRRVEHAGVHRHGPRRRQEGHVTVGIGERDGEYAGKAAARPYVIEAHTGSEPKNVAVDDAKLRKLGSLDELEAASSGWFYDADDAGGVVTVKLEPDRLGRPGRGRARRHEQRGRPRSGCRRGIRRRRPRRPRVPGRADHGLGDLPQHGHEGEGRRRADGRRARGLDARLGDRATTSAR